jgi:sugar phosphate permease
MGALSQFFNIGAVVICYLIGLIFNLTEINQEFYWRFMFSFTAIIVIVQSALLLAGVIPESPSSLIEIGKLK